MLAASRARAVEVDSLQPEPVAVGSTQVGQADVEPLRAWLLAQDPEARQGGLSVRGAGLQRQHRVDRRVRRRHSGLLRRPGQMRPKIRRHDGDDRLVIADVQLVAPELVHGPAEAIGDVPLAGRVQPVLADPQLPPRGVGTEQHHRAAHRLQKRGTHVVHRVQPVRCGKVTAGEIVVDHQARKNQEHDAQYGKRGQCDRHDDDGPRQTRAVTNRSPHGHGS